jgi:membrane protein YqaA with SNARE-associated domain
MRRRPPVRSGRRMVDLALLAHGLWPNVGPDGGMLAGLTALFLISFLGSGPFPLPLTVTILWLGQFHFPVLVVLVSTSGTLLGWISMEGVLRRWIHRKPEWAGRIPASYQRFFLRQTGFWLFVFNALPFPVDFIRFLALLNHYSRWRLLVILTVARLIRNTLLVCLGMALVKHQALFWMLLVAFLGLPLLMGRIWQSKPERARPTLPPVPDMSLEHGARDKTYDKTLIP